MSVFLGNFSLFFLNFFEGPPMSEGDWNETPENPYETVEKDPFAAPDEDEENWNNEEEDDDPFADYNHEYYDEDEE